ncbi:MAG: hypothetical protein JWN65_4012, partial [Solirubrobacterales bacterium]|nr:hypothetical protein [Solirubrobacterales bacterium]
MTSARTTLAAGGAAALASVVLMLSVTGIVGAQLGFDLWPALGSEQARLLEVPAVSPTSAGVNPLLPTANPLGGAIGSISGAAGAPAFSTGALALRLFAVAPASGAAAIPSAGTGAVAGTRTRVRLGRRSGSTGRAPSSTSATGGTGNAPQP